MQEEKSILFKPDKPWYFLGLAFLFLGISILLFTSKYFDYAMGILSALLFAASLSVFWMADIGYMTIEFSSEKIKLTGYFSIRKFEYKHSEIEGYQLKKVVDQFNLPYQQIRLKTHKGKLIVFPKVAYKNYHLLLETLTEKYNFIDYEPLKYADFYRKTLPIIALISGLLYLLRMLYKFF